MSIAPTEVEVERAKSQLKASMLLGLDGTTAIAEDIGRQLVTSGRQMTPKQIEFAIDTVTPGRSSVLPRNTSGTRTYVVLLTPLIALLLSILFQFALAAVGSIDGLLDFGRIRNDMSSMIY